LNLEILIWINIVEKGIRDYVIAKMDSLTVKTIAVFAIIFGCFAVLYPKIFHPILTNMFGATPAHHVDDDMCKGICVLST